MVNLKKEKEFFEKVSGLVFNLLSSFEQKKLTIRYKQKDGAVPNPVTSSDIAVENLLREQINSQFPSDAILGEESSSDLKIDPKIRTWIIDPICGTINYLRSIKNFCTNIALAYQGSILAACVLDHARGEFIWSTGNKEIYINDSLVKETNRLAPLLIDVNLGGSYYAKDGKTKRKYTNFLFHILTETDYMPVSHNTSLDFAYTAIGRLDGYFATASVWDVAAANFLLMQSGGIVSDISGKPWNLNSKSVLAARDKRVHKKLLDLYLNS